MVPPVGGADETDTVTLPEPEPPAPVHDAVYVVPEVSAAVVSDPEIPEADELPPETVHPVAFVDDHVMVAVPPELTDVGFAEIVTVGTRFGGCPAPGVVTDAVFESEETFPAASMARTVYVYVVFAVLPVSVYEVVFPRVVINEPPRYTRYPVTPTLSVAAFHVSTTCVALGALPERLLGALGLVVSPGSSSPSYVMVSLGRSAELAASFE